jgi:C-terminal processing protease CtpA/Prc
VQTNFDLDQVRAQLPELKQHNRTVFSGKFPDGIGYILIGTWSQPADMEAAYEALREFADAPGLIVDVRPNAGGNELLARDFAGCFHRQGAIYSRNATRDPAQPSGFSEVYDRRVEPNAKRPAIAVPVAVLMGPANMSSCESFLLMMRAAPNVKLVGDRSFGSSGNPKPHDIGGGITVFLPSWKDYLPDGTLLEGRGIDPDISVPPGNDDPTDAVLDVALAQLRKK